VKLIFSKHAWDDYLYWQRTDRKILQRLNMLLTESQRTPFAGIGKPEPLKHGMSGYWSRRITDEHRMVYKVAAEALFIAQLRSLTDFFALHFSLCRSEQPKLVDINFYIHFISKAMV
jgi:toxin YoeB